MLYFLCALFLPLQQYFIFFPSALLPLFLFLHRRSLDSFYGIRFRIYMKNPQYILKLDMIVMLTLQVENLSNLNTLNLNLDDSRFSQIGLYYFYRFAGELIQW